MRGTAWGLLAATSITIILSLTKEVPRLTAIHPDMRVQKLHYYRLAGQDCRPRRCPVQHAVETCMPHGLGH
jgi:hypothetical protein